MAAEVRLDSKRILGILSSKTRDFEVAAYSVLKEHIDEFPEDVRAEVDRLNEKLYALSKQKNKEIEEAEDYRDREIKESYWNLLKDKYYKLYSLFFLPQFITNKVRLGFLERCFGWLENNDTYKIDSFYAVVMSRSFSEGKISDALLEKCLISDDVDIAFRDWEQANNGLGLTVDSCYAEPFVLALLASGAYYNGEITDEDILMLLKKRYRVIKIMIGFLWFCDNFVNDFGNSYWLTDLRKYIREHSDVPVKDTAVTKGEFYNMEVIIKLLKYPKKEELCDSFESAYSPVVRNRPISVLGNNNNVDIEPDLRLDIEPDEVGWYRIPYSVNNEVPMYPLYLGEGCVSRDNLTIVKNLMFDVWHSLFANNPLKASPNTLVKVQDNPK